MSRCHVLEAAITAYVDGESTPVERAAVRTHLRDCASCRADVEAEAAVCHLLRAQASSARTSGAAPSWRPRVLLLGRPLMSISRASVAGVCLLAGAAGVSLWLPPKTVEAIGVVSDSFCGARHQHRPGDADGLACTNNCVAHGARYILVANDTVYQIANQQFPDLASYANLRVAVSGTIGRDALTLTRVARRDY